VLVAFGTVLGVGAFVVGSANSNESSGGAEAATVVAALAILIGAAILFLGTALILVSVVISLVERNRTLAATGWELVVLGTVLGAGAFVAYSGASAPPATVVAGFAVMFGAAILSLGTVLLLWDGDRPRGAEPSEESEANRHPQPH
jgi:4-hydroxybenzoate polyprenyltransferase